MDPVRYNELVASLEALARTAPRSLRRRVIALIALGYGYVFTILGLVLGTLAALLWFTIFGERNVLAIKLALAVGIVAWLIVKSLWVKTVAPDGDELRHGVATALDRRVEEIRAALDAPRLDTVLLTADFNAAVTQIPRLGIFGWPKTYLLLGVPLMFALDKAQFDAVLAHEFAHLSGSHPKLGLWVFRMSRTWQQLLDHLERARSWASSLFDAFFRWYVPRLQAYGFVMSRRDEYEADADAARVTSAEAMGGSLAVLEVRSRALGEEFWPGIWQRVESDAAPPDRTWSAVPALLRENALRPVYVEWLGSALQRQALDDDTHPSLGERLAALGIDATRGEPAALAAQLMPPMRASAAEHYLGDRATAMLATLEQSWRETMKDPWGQRHTELRTRRARATALLDRERAGSPLEPHELWELANAIVELEDDRAATPYLRRTVEGMPRNAAAHFLLGRALLAANDGAGVEHIRTAVSLDAELGPAGASALRYWFAEHGDRAGVESAQIEQQENEAQLRLAAAERETVTKDSTFVPAQLPPQDVEGMRAIAAAQPRISRMWVVRRVTRYLPDKPMIVVLVMPRGWRLGSWGARDTKLAQAVLSAIELTDPAHVTVYVLTGQIAWLWKKLRAVAGAEMYSR